VTAVALGPLNERGRTRRHSGGWQSTLCPALRWQHPSAQLRILTMRVWRLWGITAEPSRANWERRSLIRLTAGAPLQRGPGGAGRRPTNGRPCVRANHPRGRRCGWRMPRRACSYACGTSSLSRCRQPMERVRVGLRAATRTPPYPTRRYRLGHRPRLRCLRGARYWSSGVTELGVPSATGMGYKPLTEWGGSGPPRPRSG
jgi:hypothetical protein